MATPVSPNPSPRVRFQAIPNAITQHKALLEKPEFDRAADYALMEYNRLTAEQVRDGNSAMAMGFKLQGALEYLQTLKTLAEAAPVMMARKDLDNLPDVGQLKRQ